MKKNSVVSYCFEWVDENGIKHYSTGCYSNVNGNVTSVKDNFPQFDTLSVTKIVKR